MDKTINPGDKVSLKTMEGFLEMVVGAVTSETDVTCYYYNRITGLIETATLPICTLVLI